MMRREEIQYLGLCKLAELSVGSLTQDDLMQAMAIKAYEEQMQQAMQQQAMRQQAHEQPQQGAQFNPLRPPSQVEQERMHSYNQAGLLGAVSGTAAGTIGGKLLQRNPLSSAGIGAATGLLAALVRNFDQRSDPPGLSPVYTLPAGASLGALTGGISGAGLGRLTRYGILPGALVGAASGALGGTVVSGTV